LYPLNVQLQQRLIRTDVFTTYCRKSSNVNSKDREKTMRRYSQQSEIHVRLEMDSSGIEPR